MNRIILILFLLCSTLLSKTIITVTYPVEQFFVKRIAQNTVFIRTIEEKGYTFSEEDSKEIRRFSIANYYFTFNLEKEKKIFDILKSKNSDMQKIDMIGDIPNLYLPNKQANPYIWMDPILVRDLVKNIYEELVKIQSYNKDIFKKNYEEFLVELDEIFLDLKKRIDNSDVYGFFAFNNELDYFAKRFRINVYHKDYRYVRINEVPELIRFSRKEHIKHVLIADDKDYNIALSFSGHMDGKIVEYNLFSYNWKVNLYTILRGIENF